MPARDRKQKMEDAEYVCMSRKKRRGLVIRGGNSGQFLAFSVFVFSVQLLFCPSRDLYITRYGFLSFFFVFN